MADPEYEHPELFIGLAGVVGTDLKCLCDQMSGTLKKVGYDSTLVTLSELIGEIQDLVPNYDRNSEYERIRTLMNAGSRLRRTTNTGSILAKMSIAHITKIREKVVGDPHKPIPGHAYITKSLKHPDEVAKLRETYGRNFWLVSAYTPRDVRVGNLARKFGGVEDARCRSMAEELVERDYHGEPLDQNVRETFPEGDFFVDTGGDTERSIQRFINLIFGNTYETATPEEYGMFYAFAGAFRSSSLSRQVGASITTMDGDVVATGTNDVPKFGGGHYVTGDPNDAREFQLGHDSNTTHRNRILKNLLDALMKNGWLADKVKGGNLAEEALSIREIRGSGLLAMTEYGREVHAEMSALMDAARRTIDVKGNIMYCTTFPCHVCAKHIISSGITKVVYIEPYPKSLAGELFPDSVTVDEVAKPGRVHFKPFEGVSPRRYMDLFEMLPRKDSEGKKIPWNPATAKLRYSEAKNHDDKEGSETDSLLEILARSGMRRTR